MRRQTRRALQQYVPGELITVPVITDGAVQGYFLTKLSFSVDKDKIKHMDVPLKADGHRTRFLTFSSARS